MTAREIIQIIYLSSLSLFITNRNMPYSHLAGYANLFLFVFVIPSARHSIDYVNMSKIVSGVSIELTWWSVLSEIKVRTL